MTDIYILIDPTLPPHLAVISAHGRWQGADLAAIEYAQKHAPIEFPRAIKPSEVVQEVYKRLKIVDRDLQDED